MKVAKTLIIGIGTSGQHVCEGIANNLNSKYGDYKKANWVGIRVLETAHKSDILDKRDFIGLSIEHSDFSDYISGAQHVGREFGWNEWGDSNLLKNIPGNCINEGAGNIRMAGRLSLFHNYSSVSANITVEITRLSNLTPSDIQKSLDLKDENIDMKSGIQVYVIGSLCGGTGSGCCADFGYLLRHWGKDRPLNTITAIFTLPNWSLQKPRLKKNAFVALTELNHYMLNDSTWSQKLPGFDTPAHDNKRPYDVIYLTQPVNSQTNEISKNESTIASFLTAVCTETSHDIGAADVDAKNVLAKNTELGYLSPTFSSFGIAVLEYPGEHISRMCKERLLKKIYGTWRDDSTKDISQGRADLFEKNPKSVAEKIYDSSIVAKYEARMKEEFEKQQFEKNSSIHNKIDVIFSTINREIYDDVDINTKVNFWAENFRSNLEDKFSKILDKYIVSLNGGPGFIARILKQGKIDIDSWANSKGEIDKAYSSAKLTADTARKNIKKQTDDYLNIKGICFLVAGKRKEAWNGVLSKSVAYVKDIVRLAIAEKMKAFVDPMSSESDTIQNKYNLFADKYIQRLENFESAIVAMYKFHEERYNSELEKVPPLNGKQLYKNNIVSDEVEDIYNGILKDYSKNPNISVEQREFDMASSVIDKLKQDLFSKLTASNSSFDSRTISDIKDYLQDDIKKSIDIKSNDFFSNLSKYRHILYLVNEEGDPRAAVSLIQMASKPTLESSSAPIPVRFQNDPDIGNISVDNFTYAFCPQQESSLVRKEFKEEIVNLLTEQLTGGKPVYDSRDPYRILYLQMCHGTSLAHIKGIFKSNDSDIQALEDSIGNNDFSFWNTRKDVKWKNCLLSREVIDTIKQFWIVYRLLGYYRDANGNWKMYNKDGKPAPWYEISQGKVIVEILSNNVVVKKEKVDIDLNAAVMDISSNPSILKSIEVSCQNKIMSYIQQCEAKGNKGEFIEILFECFDNLDSYYLNVKKEEAEKYIEKYCFKNGLELEYINFKFPLDRPVDRNKFSHLVKSDTSGIPGYYCPNGHKLGNADEATLRNMIRDRFKCPLCKTDKKYWP